MKKLAIAVSVMCMIAASSCSKESIHGEGPVVTVERSFSREFFGVESSVPAKINYKIGPVRSIEIVGQQNIVDLIETSLSSQSYIQVSFRNGYRIGDHEPITINITGPKVYHLGINGSGNIDMTGDLITSNLDMSISGSGSIYVENVDAEIRIDGRISGSGSITVESGSTDLEYLTVSGSGVINLADVPARRADVNTTGSGDTRVNLTERLNVRISGSGNVWYRGNPSISSEVSGSGRVRPM